MKKINFLLQLFFICILFPDENINLISFNIHNFPIGAKTNKITEIIENVTDFDIILLQENWNFKNQIKNSIKNFTFVFSQVKNIFKSTGLTSVFKDNHLVRNYEIINFKDCNGILFNGNDCLASKGFIYSEVIIGNKFIDIYNTHLDAGNSYKDKIVRREQLLELKNYIFNKKSSNPIIVAGDFNIDYFGDESNEIKKFKTSLNLDFINWNNEYFIENKIDYIFYSKIEQMDCSQINDILYSLSDHPPMCLKFQIK